MTPPLAIIQARLHSERLPHKMLLPICGKPLLQWAWERTAQHYGGRNTVIACPENDAGVFAEHLPRAEFYGWQGDEWNVLGRFAACAHAYRDDPNDWIARITPDDFPVELERERFQLGVLEFYDDGLPPDDQFRREHIGITLLGRAHTANPGTIEINTLEDYEAAKRKVGDA